MSINTRIACQSCVWLSTRIACYNVFGSRGEFREIMHYRYFDPSNYVKIGLKIIINSDTMILMNGGV